MDWNASWIWTPPGPGSDNLYLHFRKEWTLDDLPVQASLFVTAGSLYKLWINGRLLGRGPNPADPSYYFYDVYEEVAPLLRRGQNMIAATCYQYGEKPHGIISQNWGPGGFLLEMRNGSERPLLVTDASWRVLHDPAWDQFSPVNNTLYGDFKEYVDVRRQVEVWRDDAAFDDSDWPAAVELGRPPAGPYPNLHRRQVPLFPEEPMLPVNAFWESASVNYAWRDDWEIYHEQGLVPGNPLGPADGRPAHATRTHADFSPSILLDFGRIVIGYPRVEIRDCRGGVIDVLYGEDLHLTRIDRFTLKEGPQTLEPFNRRTFRYMKLLFAEAPQKIVIDRIELRFAGYPVDMEAGAFACSDPQVTRMYDVGKWTIRLSMLDHLTDCPGRERTFYGGDLYLMQLFAAYAFNEPALARKTVRQNFAIQYPEGAVPVMGPYGGFDQFYPSWPAFSGLTLLEDYDLTGQTEFVQEMWPRFERLIDWAIAQMKANDPHLIGDPAKGGSFQQWMQGPRVRFGAWGNFPYYPMFRKGAEVARVLKKPEQAARYAAAADRMRDAIRNHLVGEDGLFRNWPPGAPGSHSPTHENGLLAWSGALDPRDTRFVTEAILRPEMPPSGGPFQDYFITADAFEHAGGDAALEYMRRTWGDMLARGATSFWEETDPRLPRDLRTHRGLSHSHGWSAGPVYFLPAYVLGIRSAEPGFASLLIEPHPCGLSWAEGKIPTPHGPVEVHWTRAADEFRMTLDLPRPARVGLPALIPQARVTVNNRPVPVGRARGRVHFPLEPGRHQVAYRIA